jgi:hypothetical protein
MSHLGVGELVRWPRIFCIVTGNPEMTLFDGAPDVRLNTHCKTKSIIFHRMKNYGADISGMAASGQARLRLPPGFSENLCLSHATCVHRRGGDVSIPLPVGKAGFPSCADASDANCSTCPDVTGDNRWNILTCRDIPSDMLIDLTSDNTRVCMTESSFGKSYQRPSNDSVNVRNIPSTVAANIPM